MTVDTTEFSAIVEALEEFVSDIENLDGIFYDLRGNPRPFADPDWLDLGVTYLNACDALGRTPVVGESPARYRS